MTEMKKHIYDESNGLWYALIGDYYIPVLTMSSEEQCPIGKWGRMYRDYIKELSLIIEQMKATEGVTEEMKAADQMAWVSAMNSIRNRAEEIILRELIYGEDVA